MIFVSKQVMYYPAKNAALFQAGDLLQAPDEGIALVNADMQRLSLQERDEVYYDIHGVAQRGEGDKQSPELVNNKLRELAHEIQNIPKSNEREAYDLACSQDQKFVEGRQIMFLKGFEYNAKMAAIRIVRNFDYRRRLFGEKALTRELCDSDLDEESKDCLFSGFLQISPLEDSSGRPMMIWIAALRNRNHSLAARVSEGEPF